MLVGCPTRGDAELPSIVSHEPWRMLIFTSMSLFDGGHHERILWFNQWFFWKCEMHCKFQGKSGIDSDTPLVTVGLTPYKTNNDVRDGDIHHTLIHDGKVVWGGQPRTRIQPIFPLVLDIFGCPKRCSQMFLCRSYGWWYVVGFYLRFVGHLEFAILKTADPKRAGFLPPQFEPWAQGLKIPCASPCRTSEFGFFTVEKFQPETSKPREKWKAVWFQRLEKPSFGRKLGELQSADLGYFLSIKMMFNSVPNKISTPTSLNSIKLASG